MLQLKIACFCVIIAGLFDHSWGYKDAKGRIRYADSRLMMQYNWPNMEKDLKRLPHIFSCDHFYAARPDGTHDIKKCPEEQSFDFKTLQCKEKSRAKCWSKQFKTDYTKKNQFVCHFPWGQYPNINDCSSFYSCLNGIARQRKCPQRSLFDKALRKCVYEAEAMCADKTDMVEPGYQCPYTWGFFTHSKDCSKYYECLQKNPSLRTCNKNMLFDNLKRTCRHKSKVNCGARLNPYELNKYSTIGSTEKGTSSEIASSSKGTYPIFRPDEKDQATEIANSSKEDYSTVGSIGKKEAKKIGSIEKDQRTETTSSNKESYSTVESTEHEEPTKIASTVGSSENKEVEEKSPKSKLNYSTVESTKKEQIAQITPSINEYSTIGSTENEDLTEKISNSKEYINIESTEKEKATDKTPSNKEYSSVVTVEKEDYSKTVASSKEHSNKEQTIKFVLSKNGEYVSVKPSEKEKATKISPTSKEKYSTFGSTKKERYSEKELSNKEAYSTDVTTGQKDSTDVERNSKEGHSTVSLTENKLQK